MKKEQFALVHLVLFFMTLLAGLVLLLMAFDAKIRAFCVLFISQPKVDLYLGLGVSFLALLLIAFFVFIHKGSHYRVELDRGFFQVEKEVAINCVQAFFAGQGFTFPLPPDISFSSHKKMEITLYLGKNTSPFFTQNLEKLERAFLKDLTNTLGYKGKCFVTVVGS